MGNEPSSPQDMQRQLDADVVTIGHTQGFSKQRDDQMSATSHVEFMKGSLAEVGEKVEANLQQYSGFVTKAGTTHGAWLWKAGNKLHHSSDAGTWTTYVHRSVVEAAKKKAQAKEREYKKRAAHFVRQPDHNMASADVEFVKGTLADATAQVEAALNQYQGYMTKSGIEHGFWLCKVGGEVVSNPEKGVWSVFLHRTVVAASDAEDRAQAQEDKLRIKRFVKKENHAMQGEFLQFHQGTEADARAEVDANLDLYMGYAVKSSEDRGAFLCKKEGKMVMVDDDGSWTMYVHQVAMEEAVHPKYKNVRSSQLYHDGMRDADMIDSPAMRPGRGEGLMDWDDELQLFGAVCSQDLRQGAVGDCWLIGALASFAQVDAKTVKSLCAQTSLSRNGRYDIKLFHAAENVWKTISVDDRLPVDKHGRLKFMKFSPDSEIWPCLYGARCVLSLLRCCSPLLLCTAAFCCCSPVLRADGL